MQVEDKRIDKRGFHYFKRTMLNGAGVNRVLETPILSIYSWMGAYPTLQVGIGNHWVAKLIFNYDHKTVVSVRLEFLRLGSFEFNVWWPGA